MSADLHFDPNWYKITELIEPNVLEVENTWFIKLKGVDDSNAPEEIRKWLKEGNIVRVIPYKRNPDARIVSDVWLGNTHINRQFVNYKRDNFIQAFEEWSKKRSSNALLSRETARELIKAFYIAESLTSSKLRASFKAWLESSLPQKRKGAFPAPLDESLKRRENALKKMIEDFNDWRKGQT